MIIVIILVSVILGNNAQKKLLSSFDTYASYVLYGDTGNPSWISTDQSSDYISMDTYQLYQQFYNSSHDEYFNKLSKLFDKFSNNYGSASKKWDDDAKIPVEQYIQNYNLLHTISNTPKIGDDVILSTFLQHGKSGALSWVEKEFSKLKTISDDGKEYFDTVYNYVEKLSGVYELYQNLGCLKSSYIDNSCVESYAPTEVEDDDLAEANKSALELELTQAYLIDSIQQGCWEIRVLIIGQSGGKDA